MLYTYIYHGSLARRSAGLAWAWVLGQVNPLRSHKFEYLCQLWQHKHAPSSRLPKRTLACAVQETWPQGVVVIIFKMRLNDSPDVAFKQNLPALYIAYIPYISGVH